MSNQTYKLSKNLYRFTFTLGSVFLLVGMLLSLVNVRVSAASSQANGNPGLGDCGAGYVEKDGSAPFTYNGSSIITSVYIKAGSPNQGEACFLFLADGTDGCYQVTGIGTTSVTVTKVGSGPTCKDISHVEFYSSPPEPTNTPEEPTATATATDTVPAPPTATATATDTVPAPPTATATATATEPEPQPGDPTATPTQASTDDPETTPVPPTETAEPEPTDIPPSAPGFTPTPTSPPTLPPPPQDPGQPPVLIPVTGVELSVQSPQLELAQRLFLNLGLGLLGLALVFYGLSNKLKEK